MRNPFGPPMIAANGEVYQYVTELPCGAFWRRRLYTGWVDFDQKPVAEPPGPLRPARPPASRALPPMSIDRLRDAFEALHKGPRCDADITIKFSNVRYDHECNRRDFDAATWDVTIEPISEG